MAKQTEEERLNWLKDRLRSVAEGASLLDFAEKNNIPIRFDPSLEQGDLKGTYAPDEKSIDLNPQTENKDLVIPLAHELRHAWQYNILNIKSRTLVPKDFIIFHRLIEGDAHAFHAFLKRKLHLQKAPSFIKKSPAFIKKILGYDEPDFQKEMEKGFTKFQESFIAHDYYDLPKLDIIVTMLEILKKNESFLTSPDRIYFSKKLSDVFNDASALAPPTTPDAPGFLYMGAKNMDELAEKIYQHVPSKTRKKIAALS